ncbi:ParM/StbA family protein [Maridesulfovibrio sp.]|uniref:ParM/StbA family protein n=1 Tax=Maridesulfovibrio sp. TaxID=2795000 RepID=UPI002A1883D5|nr:ParM/StbA family protein [Maridesulfovibrio sp.]
MKKNVVALDIGYSNFRVAYGQGDKFKSCIFPAGVKEGHSCNIKAKEEHDPPFCVNIGGISHIAGIEPMQTETRALHRWYIESDQYLALFYAGLIQSGYSKIDCLVTGVTMSEYLEGTQVKQLTKMMTGVHHVAPNVKIEVDDVHVVAQPFGSYFNSILRNSMDRFLSSVLVFDAGFYSLDWALFHKGKIIESTSGSSMLAVSMVLEEVSKLLYKDCRMALPIAEIEAALRKGRNYVFCFGKKHKLDSYIKRATEKMSTEIYDTILNRLRMSENPVDIVVLTGGGVVYYEDIVRRIFPSSELIIEPDPLFSAVHGYYHYGLSKQG